MYKVLIADSDLVTLNKLGKMVEWEKFGFYICAEASNGEDALNMIKACNPELVILDINLPILNGHEIIKETSVIKGNNSRFIIKSIDDKFSNIYEVLEYNTKAYIKNPIDIDNLNHNIETIANEISKENEMRRIVEQRLVFVIEDFINDVIKSHDTNVEAIEKSRNILGIDENQNIICILFKFDDDRILGEEDFENKKAFRDCVRKIIERRIGHIHNTKIFELYDDTMCAIIDDSMDFYNDFERNIKYLKKTLENECSQSFSIAISNRGDSIYDLKKIYQNAKKALEYVFYEEDNRVVYYDEIKFWKIDEKINFSGTDGIINSVKRLDETMLRVNIDSIFRKFYSKLYSRRVIEAYIKNLEIELLRLLYKDAEKQKIISKIYYIDKIVLNSKLIEIKNSIIDLCYEIIDILKSKEIDGNIIIQVCEYIEKNYMEDIKISDVAEKYHFNAGYFGGLFYKKSGYRFNDYLNYIRINEAKKLLKQTKNKLNSVALQVGYSDSSYFTSQFRKITGLLPSQYRKSGENS